MLMKSKVFFKGKGSGLIIALDEDSSYEELREELIEKVKKSKTFFTGASEDIKFEGKVLESSQENELADIIINHAGMEIGFINPENNESFATKKRESAQPQEADEQETDASSVKTIVTDSEAERSGILESGESVLIYNGFVRSGKLVEADSNIVIIGGVNPGGEVFAGRNIIVFGQLKGKAVAGRNGNVDSFIAAILMEPELLGISNYVTRFPDSKKDELYKTPCIARLKSNKIVISPVSNLGAFR